MAHTSPRTAALPQPQRTFEPCAALYGEVRDEPIVLPNWSVTIGRSNGSGGLKIASGGLNEIWTIVASELLGTACEAGEPTDGCAARYVLRRTKRLSKSRQPTLLGGMGELALTKALSERGVMPRVSTFWLELAAPFSTSNRLHGATHSYKSRASRQPHFASVRVQQQRQQEQQVWQQPVHVNIVVEKVTPLPTPMPAAEQWQQLVHLVEMTAATDLSESRAGKIT